jgi:hypothetical protein
MSVTYGSRVVMEVPKDVAAHLTRVGGRNLYGEPNYRLVWGPSRLEWMGGKFEAKEFGGAHVGVHRVPRYHADEWVLERWLSPLEIGSKEAWDARTERIDGHTVEPLGPYPSRGDYEAVTSFPPVIELNMAVADILTQVVNRSRATRRADRAGAIRKRMEKKESEWSSWADDVISDAFPSFHGAPFVGLST